MLTKPARHVRGVGLLLVLLLLVATGCGKKTVAVSGKVTYRGQALPAGTVRFVTADQSVLAAEIGRDGTYTVPRVPMGEVKVSVSVPAAQALMPQQKGINGKAEGDKSAPAVAPPKVVLIPNHYSNPETSSLKYSVTNESAQTYNIPLQ